MPLPAHKRNERESLTLPLSGRGATLDQSGVPEEVPVNPCPSQGCLAGQYEAFDAMWAMAIMWLFRIRPR
jgi:hypothetical protein